MLCRRDVTVLNIIVDVISVYLRLFGVHLSPENRFRVALNNEVVTELNIISWQFQDFSVINHEAFTLVRLLIGHTTNDETGSQKTNTNGVVDCRGC